MKYGSSGQKYYRFRKAAQEATIKVLRQFGELPEPREKAEPGLDPLRRELQAIIGAMLTEYPELNALFDRGGRGAPVTGVFPEEEGPITGATLEGTDAMTGTRGGRGPGSGIDIAPGGSPGERIDPFVEGDVRGRLHEGRRRPPTIFIAYESDPGREELGWLREGTLWINEAHPAFQRAASTGALEYHVIVSAGWALLGYIEPDKRPEFMNKVLTGWGGRS